MGTKLKKIYRIVAPDHKVLIIDGEFNEGSTTETIDKYAYDFKTKEEKEKKIKDDHFIKPKINS